MQKGEPARAIELICEALRTNPAHAQALANLGGAYMYINQPDKALRSYDRALELEPRFLGVLNNRGNVLQMLSRHTEAADSFQRLLELSPGFDYARGSFFLSRRHCCDWRDYSINVEQIAAGVAKGICVDGPFSFLSVCGSPALQLRCARSYAKYVGALAVQRVWDGPRYRHDRIRVAYLSADFRNHVVANLMARIYELHDKRHFHTIGVALAADDDSDIVRRAKAALGEFINVSQITDEQVVNKLRGLEVDIAVDLTGYTQGCRPGIFALRPAPVQVNLFGFPATLGANLADYLIADEFVVPDSATAHYAERIVRLPHSFQANDDRRADLSVAGISREAAGLPASGLVLCCFNNSYKLNPAVFDIWMRLLEAQPNSVLWLLGGEPTTQTNLCKEAEARGVPAERLVFAHRVSYAEHLARLRLADLFLDTLPFNGGATASDALWAGVPVLTCAGDAFASRMAGSLLRAVGLSELITYTPEQYERCAMDLIRDNHRLSDLSRKLAANRDDYPLFKTETYCRNLEAAYRRMWELAEGGEPPASFTVAN